MMWNWCWPQNTSVANDWSGRILIDQDLNPEGSVYSDLFTNKTHPRATAHVTVNPHGPTSLALTLGAKDFRGILAETRLRKSRLCLCVVLLSPPASGRLYTPAHAAVDRARARLGGATEICRRGTLHRDTHRTKVRRDASNKSVEGIRPDRHEKLGNAVQATRRSGGGRKCGRAPPRGTYIPTNSPDGPVFGEAYDRPLGSSASEPDVKSYVSTLPVTRR